MALQVVITENRALNDTATNDDTSTVGEPSVAISGKRRFVTGNWYASRSADAGASWGWVDPANTLPSAAGGFCCDQLILYDTRRRIWIWILQYVEQNDTNVFRIAVSRNAYRAGSTWHWWDIAPATLNRAWTDVWFDYPDAALGAEDLYVTFNVFRGNDWQRAAVMRFPLDTLASGGSLGFSWWSTTDNGSLRLTQQARPGRDMYWASHNTTSQLRVFSWPAGAGGVSWWDIDIRSWNPAIASTAPNGVNWLARADSRITGSTLGNGRLTFMWTAGADQGRPHAYCRVVRIDEASMTVQDEPDIWSNARAWAYPATCAARNGRVGFVAFYGGVDRTPGLVVGGRDDAAATWRTVYARQGTHSPAQGRWGDYLNCRADTSAAGAWVASGYALEGGDQRTDIRPRVVSFRLR